MKLSEINLDLEILHDGIFDSLGKLNSSNSNNTLSFITNENYIHTLKKSKNISSLVLNRALLDKIDFYNGGVIISENPKETFFIIHEYLSQNSFYNTFNTSKVASSAKVAGTAIISTMNVQIGENVQIEEHVVIKENTIIGDNTIIRAGSVIGTAGFEVTNISGIQKVIEHAGWVIIGKNVEIQANCAISKGLFPSRNTVISDEVKIDNLVHIAHGAFIGKRCKIAASALISGNVTIKEDVWIGPGVVTSNNITIEKGANLSLGAIVITNVPETTKLSPIFAAPHEKVMKQYMKLFQEKNFK